jgi:FO synthase
MFGHIDGSWDWAHHVVTLLALEQETGGMTAFVPLPFAPMEAPMALRGRSRHGPTIEEAPLMYAVGRLALHQHITNVHASCREHGRVPRTHLMRPRPQARDVALAAEGR